MIITDNQTLMARLHDLGPGDVVVGRVRVRPGEEGILLYLESRGVRMVPPALAQLLSRSKVMQAAVLGRFMPPLTVPVYTRHDLMEVIALYGEKGVGRVVSKQDRGDAGFGVHLWPDIEAVHNQVCFGRLGFPFVVQPFIEGCRDLRMIVLGDHVEAYWRENPSGFRNNLGRGGRSRPAEPERGWLGLAELVMRAGRFPYAHIDLLFDAGGGFHLGEINLRGGLHGARIGPEEYRRRLEAIHAAETEDRETGDKKGKTG
jgi:ribosomal protein S6--L-glutamate ligase